MLTSRKHNTSHSYKNIIESRFGPVLLAVSLLCLISILTRLALASVAYKAIDWSVLNIFKIIFVGLFYDLAAASYAIIPLVLYLWLCPSKFYNSKVNRFLLLLYFFIIILTLLFNAIAEWFFWDEFSVRYNFIAVDYLVYTTEVIGNIRQSYPINTILTLLILVAAGLTFAFRKVILASTFIKTKFVNRYKIALVLLVFPFLTYFLVNHKWKNHSSNQYVNELSGNGMYEFGYAFWHNELDYETFYKTLPIKQAITVFRNSLGLANGKLTERNIIVPAPEKRMNVVLISVESLSADFLESFGNTQHITPNLDSLAHKGILFTNLYASGTRTVRGLEALSLCIPPTPGQSIVKRQDNKNLFTLGSVFRSKGYSSRYIYGGYGYFDNMNEFFSKNGYEVTDRSELNDKEIHYENIWGVADEDLFTLSFRKLDGDYKAGKPFFAHIMTVSNHRPYTYPAGRIDIPSHSGREGAVKYTDYAIGKFIKDAESKPWFANTLFVIVADHCASSAGKVELPVDKYHIPMIMYAPNFLKPAKYDKLMAQIDVGPTILGLLNFNYKSKFFGQDVFGITDNQHRAFISTYQSLGFVKDGKLVILEPQQKVKTFEPNFKTGEERQIQNIESLTNEAIANYQLASYLYGNGLYMDK